MECIEMGRRKPRELGLGPVRIRGVKVAKAAEEKIRILCYRIAIAGSGNG
jgi:hypothetical protein